MLGTKKIADDSRNHSSFPPAIIPEGQPMHVIINNSGGCQQTLSGLATTPNGNSTKYVTTLITHPQRTQMQNLLVKTGTHNLSEKTSLCRLRFICFAREMTQRVTGLEQDQNHRL